MKPLWCVFLVGALSCLCIGCGQQQIEQPTEEEVKQDLQDQQEMMKAAESGHGG
ncbi:MAG: hypothetical protein GX575_08695 [Candidatus Anammoximicrobium sp.]|nr:hypothetical protein [Candidatus Anammoximicrobium sp.]